MSSLDQNLERKEKMILVAYYDLGLRRTVWGLVAAVKVGRHYKISHASMQELCAKGRK